MFFKANIHLNTSTLVCIDRVTIYVSYEEESSQLFRSRLGQIHLVCNMDLKQPLQQLQIGKDCGT